MKKTIRETGNFIFGMTAILQTGMGLLWVLFQFPHLQNFRSTYELLEVSGTLVSDEYTGILYPLFLKLFRLIEEGCKIPFYIPVYLLQMFCAGMSAWLLFGTLFEEKNRLRQGLSAAYLVSFPLLLQFHMAVRPESLAFSGLLLLTAAIIKENRNSRVVVLNRVRLGITIIIPVLLIPDMLFAETAMLLFSGIFWMIKRKKNKSFALAALLSLLAAFGLHALTSSPGSGGKIQKSFWAAMFQRTVTEYFSRSYAVWDPDVRSVFTIEEAMECAKRSDNMMYVVGPALEEAWGSQRADELYRQMALDCTRIRTRSIVFRIRDDAFDSVLMPFSVLWQNQRGRLSQTGWNYDRFREQSPGLSPFYFRFGVLALMLLTLLALIQRLLAKKRWEKGIWLFALGAAVHCSVVVLSTGNAVDYGNLLPAIGLWCMIGTKSLEEKEREKEVGADG